MNRVNEYALGAFLLTGLSACGSGADRSADFENTPEVAMSVNAVETSVRAGQYTFAEIVKELASTFQSGNYRKFSETNKINQINCGPSVCEVIGSSE